MSAPYESFIEEIDEHGYQYSSVLFKLSNAVLVFFYEKGRSARLGTLAVAMPQFGGKTCVSSILLGERNMVITKILAERISNAYHGIALVSTHLPEIQGTEASSMLLKLTQKILDKADLKQHTALSKSF